MLVPIGESTAQRRNQNCGRAPGQWSHTPRCPPPVPAPSRASSALKSAELSSDNSRAKSWHLLTALAPFHPAPCQPSLGLPGSGVHPASPDVSHDAPSPPPRPLHAAGRQAVDKAANVSLWSLMTCRHRANAIAPSLWRESHCGRSLSHGGPGLGQGCRVPACSC